MTGRTNAEIRAEGGQTTVTREKLKELWMSHVWAGPSERHDAERAFDEAWPAETPPPPPPPPLPYPAARELLDRVDAEREKPGTLTGFSWTREKLAKLVTDEVSDHAPVQVAIGYESGDMTSFRITLFVSYSRSELDALERAGR